MVSDLLFFAGIAIAGTGLIWWSPPAAVIAAGLALMVIGISKHTPPAAPRGRDHG